MYVKNISTLLYGRQKLWKSFCCVTFCCVYSVTQYTKLIYWVDINSVYRVMQTGWFKNSLRNCHIPILTLHENAVIMLKSKVLIFSRNGDKDTLSIWNVISPVLLLQALHYTVFKKFKYWSPHYHYILFTYLNTYRLLLSRWNGFLFGELESDESLVEPSSLASGDRYDPKLWGLLWKGFEFSLAEPTQWTWGEEEWLV